MSEATTQKSSPAIASEELYKKIIESEVTKTNTLHYLHRARSDAQWEFGTRDALKLTLSLPLILVP